MALVLMKCKCDSLPVDQEFQPKVPRVQKVQLVGCERVDQDLSQTCLWSGCLRNQPVSKLNFHSLATAPTKTVPMMRGRLFDPATAAVGPW